MKVVIQRVKRASVLVDQRVVGQIGQGLVVFVGVGRDDRENDIKPFVERLVNLRIFENEENKFDQSLLDVDGEILVIPQFTLYADLSKGRRPFFGEAARPDLAEPLLKRLVEELKKTGLKIEKGEFGAKMEVVVVNDGPVTIVFET